MSWLFGARKTPADLLRENKRMLDKAIRELDRERTALQAQEKKLVAEIKRTAKQGQMAAVRVMAKDLIRTRHSVTKFYSLKSQLQGVSLRMQTLKSTQAMADAMRCARSRRGARRARALTLTPARRTLVSGVTRAMGSMNRQLNLPALQGIMREFERQNERMETTTEVMGDTIDDAFEEEGEAEETDELVNQARVARGTPRHARALTRTGRARCWTRLGARSARSCWTRPLRRAPWPRRPQPRARPWPRPQAATAWTATCSRGWTRCAAGN